jgi:hypothetical protein
MIKYFENNIVLTSQNPEAWIIFSWDGNDTEIEPSINFTDEKVWINGWNYNTINDASSAGIILDSTTKIAPFHIYTDNKEDFDVSLGFSYLDPTNITYSNFALPWDTTNANNLSDYFLADNRFYVLLDSNNHEDEAIFSNPIPVEEGSQVTIYYAWESGQDASAFVQVYTPGPSYDGPFYSNEIGGGGGSGASGSDSSTFTIPIGSGVTEISVAGIIGKSSYTVDIIDVYDITLTVDNSSNVTTEYVNIFNRPFLLESEEFNTFETFNPQVDNEASYLLLRTNPKYSGNIKLVADTNDHLYLDTFKVSDILSNKKYRKQQVSGNSFLSGDIRRVFSTLPQGEIYRLGDDDTLNIENPETEYSNQFETIYDYGAKMLIDELYSEEFSILAPLWVNSKIPDYFVLFRLPGTYNDTTYNTTPNLNGLAESYITDGQLIESWNLKENSPLGQYLDNHLSELLNVESPVNLSLNEYDPNTWNGIAVDKGIITGRSEVPYFFQQITDNFTETNAFISQGFERQGLLCPNLINMEFVFNDKDVSSYTMNRYFGFYMTENKLYKFAYYSDSSTGADFNIISLDGRDVSVFIDSSIFDSNGNISGSYNNRIFVRNDGIDLERICCTTQIDGSRSQIESYINKLGTNIISTLVENKNINPYISLKINNLLPQGEHLRIINLSQGKIWEVYGVESDFFSPGEAGPYVSYNEPSEGYPVLYRTAFSVKGSINDQVNAISNAFKLFREYSDYNFSVGFTKENGLSLILDNDIGDSYAFQRLTGQIAYSIGDPSSTFNSAASPEDITYFGVFTPDASDFERIPYDASYGPIDFELYGDRFSIFVNFMDVSNYYTYSFDASVTESFTDNILYTAKDNWNRLIQHFDVSAGNSYSYLYTEDPTSVNNKALILTEKEIALDQTNTWYGYDVYPISVSLMGINPVKYFDYTVYDSCLGFQSDYRTSREFDEETYKVEIPFGSTKTFTSRNSYIITEGKGFIDVDSSTVTYNVTSPDKVPFNTFFNDVTIRATADTVVTYNTLDGSFNYTSYDTSISEENLEDYYKLNFLIDGSGNQYQNKIELKYGLVVPTISKWGTNGRDSRGNPVRLLLTTDLFEDPSAINSNFIPVPDTSLYTNELSYPVFKYLSPGENSWKDYVYYDINDVVDYNGTRKSIRELMFEELYTDIFSKILYNNNQVSGDATRSSILYYNLYENKVITIIGGVKLGIEVTPAGQRLFNVTNWNRYRFSLISSPTRNAAHNKPIEVIVNKNTETILMIWYQGADVLHYNKRYSDIVPGKNILSDYNNKGGIEYMGIPTGDPSYSYVKSSFIINTNSVSTPIVNIFEESTVSNYDTSIVTPLAQFGFNDKNDLNSIFNAYETVDGDNKVVSGQFQFLKSFDSFDQNEIDYTYAPSVLSFGTNITNITYNYLNNYNYYKDKTCNIDIFKDIIDNNNIQYYIIQEDEIYTSQIFESQPVSVTLYDPVLYKSPGYDTSIYTYNGPYRPLFKNVINFEDNETSELINILEKDFVFSNTNLQSYNNIEQYWINRVVENVTAADGSNNILYIEDFNPFKSLWDNDYFVLSEGSTEVLVDGYFSDLEQSSMFGSKLISLPETITLDNWNAGNSKLVIKTDYYSMEFNLTKTIIDLFTNNNTFIQNWDGLPEVTDDIINKYIIKTVLRNYNISINKIITDVYSKPYDGEILKRTFDSSLFKVFNNFDSELAVVNDEYIYKIKVYEGENKSYFSKFTFTKK